MIDQMFFELMSCYFRNIWNISALESLARLNEIVVMRMKTVVEVVEASHTIVETLGNRRRGHHTSQEYQENSFLTAIANNTISENDKRKRR